MRRRTDKWRLAGKVAPLAEISGRPVSLGHILPVPEDDGVGSSDEAEAADPVDGEGFDDSDDEAGPVITGAAAEDPDEWERLVAEVNADLVSAGGALEVASFLPARRRTTARGRGGPTDPAGAGGAATGPEDVVLSEDDDDLSDSGSVRAAEHAARFAPAAEDPHAARKLQLVSRKLRQFKDRYVAMKQARDAARSSERLQLQKAEELQRAHAEEKAELELRLNSRGPGFGALAAMGGGRAAELAMRKKRREEQRRKLFMQSTGADDDDALDDSTAGNLVQQLWGRALRFVRRRMPLQKALRSVEARYGTSVAAYFGFLRWVVVIYLALGVVCAVALAFHLLRLWSNGTLSSQLWTGGLLLPRAVYVSSYGTDEALSYAALQFGCSALLLLVALNKWVLEDFRSKQKGIFEGDVAAGHTKFSRLCLNAWDFSAAKPAEVADLRFALADNVDTMLNEELLKKAAQRRTNGQLAKLYSRRAAGSILYVALQAAGWVGLLWLTSESQTVEGWLEDTPFSSAAATLVPAVASLINALLPPVITAITNFEQWPTKVRMKFMVFRLYLAKMFNALIQVFSYVLLLDPTLFVSDEVVFGAFPSFTQRKIRELAQVRVSAEYSCRAEQVGAGLTILVLTEFVLSKIILLAAPLGTRALARLRGKAGTAKPEFLVAEAMVSLLYFQLLVGVVTPFCPSMTILGALFFAGNFQFEHFRLRTFLQKSKKPWSAKDAGSFFIKFYLLTVVIGLVVAQYFLSIRTLPKSCAVQDQSIALCVNGTYDAAAERCTLASAHALGTYFASGSAGCASHYPHCLCHGGLACGPFVQRERGYSALVEYVSGSPFLSTLYQAAGEYLVLYTMLILVSLRLFLKGNTLHVIRDVNEVKEQEYKSIVQALEKKIRLQSRELQAHKKMSARMEEESGPV